MQAVLDPSRWAAVAVAALCAGCATLTLPSMQSIQVLALDPHDRPVAGLQCTLRNDHGEVSARTPAFDVQVRRSGSPLQIECRRGHDVALGTVVPRRDMLEQALVPFGSVAVALDHLTGHLYAYPSVVRLRLGQHLRFEFSTEARVAAVVATVGDSTSVDLSAGAPAREPLPATAPTTTPPVDAAARAAPASPPRRVRATPAPERAPARRDAPLTW